jgi:hypothetical protein
MNATTSHQENVLKRKSDDVGWEYGSLIDPSNLDKVFFFEQEIDPEGSRRCIH